MQRNAWSGPRTGQTGAAELREHEWNDESDEEDAGWSDDDEDWTGEEEEDEDWDGDDEWGGDDEE